MTIQLGIYDFFAYAVPGGLYLLLLTYLLAVFSGNKFDFASLSDLSLVQTLIFTVIAYLTGLVIDRIAVFWYRIFEPSQLEENVLEKLRQRYSNLGFKFQGKDWAVLIAYLQREKPETTSEIHRFNAIHIFLKNASFAFAILSIAEVVLLIVNHLDWTYLLISVSAAISSIISARQAVRFKRWFFSANFEAVIAKSLEQSDLVIKRNQSLGMLEVKADEGSSK